MNDWLGMAAPPRAPRAELKERVLSRAARAGRARWSRFRRLAIAAALAGVVVTGGWWAAARIGALRAERDDLAAALRLLHSPGARTVTAPVSIGGRPAGSVTILADSAGHRWLVRCDGMTPNTPDQTYQIWVITAEGPRHAALMTMRDDQSSVMTMTVELPANVGRVEGAAMTIEPRVGSPEPRGPMVFQARL